MSKQDEINIKLMNLIQEQQVAMQQLQAFLVILSDDYLKMVDKITEQNHAIDNLLNK